MPRGGSEPVNMCKENYGPFNVALACDNSTSGRWLNCWESWGTLMTNAPLGKASLDSRMSLQKPCVENPADNEEKLQERAAKAHAVCQALSAKTARTPAEAGGGKHNKKSSDNSNGTRRKQARRRGGPKLERVRQQPQGGALGVQEAQGDVVGTRSRTSARSSGGKRGTISSVSNWSPSGSGWRSGAAPWAGRA